MKFLRSCLLVACCHTALAFQARASDFRFVISTSPTRANKVLSKGTTAIQVSFQGSDSIPKSVFDEKSILLLKEAIGSNTTAAETLLSDVKAMRENGKSEEDIEACWNNLLAFGPDASLPFWTKSKRLARFSRRARMASLKRTLDLTTPASDSDEDESEERKLYRRRRALVSLLRSLSSEDFSKEKGPAIVTLERKVLQASKEEALDMRSRMPEGLETPKYDILAERKLGTRKVEIRRYEPYSVCSVSMNKPRPAESKETEAKLQMPEMKGASSFGALAGYLFGKNDKSTAMKMTTPVFTSPVEDGDKDMEFVLPSDYWEAGSLDTAPQPLSGSGVILKQRASEDRAVLMFGGYASKAEVAKQKKQLMDALKKDSQWKDDGKEATVAQYNDPFTVPWRRLNEVSIKVVAK
jgi:hypothetical protein